MKQEYQITVKISPLCFEYIEFLKMSMPDHSIDTIADYILAEGIKRITQNMENL